MNTTMTGTGMAQANDLQAIRAGVLPFSEGYMRTEHRVGRYTFLEYHPHTADGKETDWDRVRFAGFVNNHDMRMSWDTIEDAMVGLVAWIKIRQISENSRPKPSSQ
jgi:hypothetical protein